MGIVTKRELLKELGAVMGVSSFSVAGNAWHEPDIEIDWFYFSKHYVEVYDGEQGWIYISLENNTNEERTVFLDYIPYLRRSTDRGTQEVEFPSADLTPSDAIHKTFVTISGGSTLSQWYQWSPHLQMPADVGPYNAKLEVKSERDGVVHDVEHSEWAFRIQEVDECRGPYGYPSIQKYLVDREDKDC